MKKHNVKYFPRLSKIAIGAAIGPLLDEGTDKEGEYITVEKHMELDGYFTANDLRKIADWIDNADPN